MTDPEDPPPPVDVRLPEMQLDEDSDPDLVVGWGQVAAAQLAVLDEAVDGLQQAIADREDADEWSWMFCSLGGIPLGEHGSLGLPQQVGYSEEVAAAAMVRPANSIPIGSRRGELCQLPDITATLLAAMNLLPADSLTWARSLLQAAPPSCTSDWSPQLSWAWGEHAGRLWLRTPAWSLIQRDTDTIELYVKPDDRWEVNDVADRSSDVVEQLTALLPQVRAATQAGRRDDLPPVPEILANLFR